MRDYSEVAKGKEVRFFLSVYNLHSHTSRVHMQKNRTGKAPEEGNEQGESRAEGAMSTQTERQQNRDIKKQEEKMLHMRRRLKSCNNHWICFHHGGLSLSGGEASSRIFRQI